MTPEEFRLQFMKSRGLNINNTSIPQMPVEPPPVPLPPPGAPPGFDPNTAIRLPDNNVGSSTWRAGINQDIAAGVIPNPATPPVVPPIPPSAPYAKPAAFPTESAPAIPYNPVPDPGPAGISLTSTPIAPGWAGTVGLPGTPEEAKAFEKGGDYQKLMSGLDDVAKGLKPKPVVDHGASTITPMASQPNQSNQMAAQLMTAMMNKNRGLTLTGR